MRRSASEIVRNLEMRIARLESRKTSRTAGGFNFYSHIEHNRCVIMLDTHDSDMLEALYDNTNMDLKKLNSETFHYCFMHLQDKVLNNAVKYFMADMKEGQRMGIIKSVRTTSASGNAVSFTLEFSESLDLLMESESNVDWIKDKCWERKNMINIG